MHWDSKTSYSLGKTERLLKQKFCWGQAGEVWEVVRKIIEEVKEIQEAKELVRFSGYSIFFIMCVCGGAAWTCGVTCPKESSSQRVCSYQLSDPSISSVSNILKDFYSMFSLFHTFVLLFFTLLAKSDTFYYRHMRENLGWDGWYWKMLNLSLLCGFFH